MLQRCFAYTAIIIITAIITAIPAMLAYASISVMNLKSQA
jgi:hypothetical protein